MRIVFTVFRKELIDSLRDRRTLIAMLAMPLVLLPLLMGVVAKTQSVQQEKAAERILNVGLRTQGNAAAFRSLLEGRGDILLERGKIRIFDGLAVDQGRALVESDSLDAFISFDPAFDRQVEHLLPGKVALYYKGSKADRSESERLLTLLRAFADDLHTARFRQLGLDPLVAQAVAIDERNLASEKEQLAEIMGGILPYLFIIFSFMGSMYPAIDLAAGEKERGTLETLLTTPTRRMEILLGKFGVVMLTGLFSAIVSIAGMSLGVSLIDTASPLYETIVTILEVKTILLLLSLLLPLTVFFAALSLSLSLYARSFKEAQNIITPMMFVVIVPAFIGVMPGMELNSVTALIPILNVSLTTKAIIAAKTTPLLMAQVYGSLLVLAAFSLFICGKIFEREEVIFRGV